MDIFAMADEATRLAEQEIVNTELEAKKLKEQKVDIKAVFKAIAEKDYSFYKTEIIDKGLEKAFSPFMLNLWMSKLSGKGLSHSRKDQMIIDQEYANIIIAANSNVNKNLYTFSKPMAFLRSCTIIDEPLTDLLSSYGREFKFDFIREEKKTSKIKVSTELMDFLQKELMTSSDKIKDMINNDIITSENIKALQKDLDTLYEKPKQTKRRTKKTK